MIAFNAALIARRTTRRKRECIRFSNSIALAHAPGIFSGPRTKRRFTICSSVRPPTFRRVSAGIAPRRHRLHTYTYTRTACMTSSVLVEAGDLPMRTAAGRRHDDIRGHCFTSSYLIPLPPIPAPTLCTLPVYAGGAAGPAERVRILSAHLRSALMRSSGRPEVHHIVGFGGQFIKRKTATA